VRPQDKAELVARARALHAAGWCANHDGNASLRIGRDRFLCTPTAVSKADVDERMLLVVNEKGEVLEGTRKPFGELEVHLAVYRARPDVNAVLHAHPPVSTAFGIAGVSLEVATMPEFTVSLGAGVPTVPLFLPKTPELVRAVEEVARKANAFLAAGNGTWALGTDLEQAWLRLELVEHYAKIIAGARALGGVRELAPDAVKKLLEARAKAGLEPPGAADPTKAVVPAAPKPAAAAPSPKSGKSFPARPAGAPAAPDIEDIATRVADRLSGRAPAEGELQKLVAEEIRAVVGRGA
jgi:L-fuculose-phosphate aldolase